MNDVLHEEQPMFSHIEPVLAVSDVAATIRYWHEVLGFPNQWVWKDPPEHGGVSWHNAAVQFTKSPERAQASAGNYIWCRVKYIEQLYKIHQERKADIVDPLQNRPWGLDEYIVKENNGYHVVFSGNVADRKKSAGFPENISIVARNPTIEEFVALHHSVGWTDSIKMDYIQAQLSAPVYSVVAINTTTNEMIGCALLISDNASFYYVKDVMVKQEWQHQRVGTALMKALVDWLDKNGIKKSLVGLYTRENLEPFYAQFGFYKSFGMAKTIN